MATKMTVPDIAQLTAALAKGAANSDQVMTDAANAAALADQKKACADGLHSWNDAANKCNDGTASDQPPTCEMSINPLSWILCPVLTAIVGAVGGIADMIKQVMGVNIDPNAPGGKDIFKAWSNFRIIGNILLLIGVLVVVFSEVIGGGIVEAYTVRKILPRLLIGAVLINLSFYIMLALIDIFNVLGNGVYSLITIPFGGGGLHKINIDIVGGVLGNLGVAGLVGLVGTGIGNAILLDSLPLLGLMVLLPAFLIFLAVLFVIIIRQGLILLLLIMSPVAFALYCLPNTERYFKAWWEQTFKALLVFPIIMALFGLSTALSSVLGAASLGLATPLKMIVQLIVLLAPIALIVFAFKLAGGLLGNVIETGRALGSKAHQGILGNPNDRNSWRNRAKRQAAFGITRQQTAAIDAVEGRKNGSVNRRQRALYRAVRATSWGLDKRASRYMQEAREEEDAMSATGRDNLRYASVGMMIPAGHAVPSTFSDFSGSKGLSPSTDDRYFDSKGRQITPELYSRARSESARSGFHTAQGLEYTARKIQTDDDIANFRYAFANAAVANNWNDHEVGDAWAAATFAHKKEMGAQWFSSPNATRGADGRVTGVSYNDITNDTPDGHKQFGKFISEPHKRRRQFDLSEMLDTDVRDQAYVQRRTEDKITGSGTPTVATKAAVSDTELENLAMTSDMMESLSHRGIATVDSEGEYSVSGGSAIANKIMAQMFKERRIVSREVIQPDGRSSVNERSFYNKHDVDQERRLYNASRKKGDPAFDEQAAIDRHTLRDELGNTRIVKVTGDIDRPDVPR
ncbi:MAG TPA: hypothetical protein PK865_01380 [Candidatus Saccharibacteria bacterium]|nr:hypothetical protein [Candidatus Saccharibacteria bacterium]